MSEQLGDGDFIGHYGCIASELKESDVKRWGNQDFEDCSSSNALSVYEHDLGEGGVTYSGYCFSCDQGVRPEHIGKSSLAEEVGMDTTGVVGTKKEFVKKEKQPALTRQQVKDLMGKMGYSDKDYRGIRPETLKFFGHLAKRDKMGEVKAFYYPETRDNADGKFDPWPTGYKIRYLPKYFSKMGMTGIKSHLAGQAKFMQGNPRDILIVGGEVDMASAYQMLLDNQASRNKGAGSDTYAVMPVVSPTTGEGSAAKQVAAQYDFFDRAENILIGMDSDEAGIAAAKAIAAVLPKDKVKLVSWSNKDPNNMLTKGKQKQFMSDIWAAKDLVPTELVSSSTTLDGAIEFLKSPKIPLPPFLHRLQTAMRGGIKTTGAIISLIGDTSIGKSLFTDALLYHWFWHSPLVPTIVSIERESSEITLDFISMHLRDNLASYEDYNDALAVINAPANQEKIQDLLVNEEGMSRYHILDDRSGTVDNLKATIEKAIVKLGSRLIIIDPLTDLLRSLPISEQENFLMWQKQKKKEGIVFINVLHTRKPSANKDGKIPETTEYDILGSGTFVQSADANIIINRNKMAECPILRNTTKITLPKIRGGITGHAGDIYYDYKERNLYDLEDHLAANPALAAMRLPVEGEKEQKGRFKRDKSEEVVKGSVHDF